MTRPFALLFPGQGAQEVGMGRDLLAKDAFTQSLVRLASDAADKDLCALCLKGPDRVLAETRYLQPALTCICLGLLRRFQEVAPTPSATAGHSAGELSALVASGMASPEEIVTSAATRGRLMSEAAEQRQGGMAAVSGKTPEEVEAEIQAVKTDGDVLCIGAVNAPSQVTISGDKHMIAAFGKTGLRTAALRVSGAWHSSHMAPAVQPFEQSFAAVSLSAPKIPMILNRDGRAAQGPEAARTALPRQLIQPVRWDLVMKQLLALNIRDFVEMGPGKVLRGLVRLNDKSEDISVHNVSDIRSLTRAVSALAGS
jgi:[acyl-carrier-protein] S-malonyltransferase